jgi:heptosyltransferase-1
VSDETASALLNRASADSESPDAASQGPSRILVVRLGSMGDIIHTLPAVAMLRRAFPFAKLGWLVEQRWVELLAARGSALVAPRGLQKPLVDAVHVVDTLAWRLAPFSGETRSQALRAYRELRQAGYEVAVDFQGAIRSAALAFRAASAPCSRGRSRRRCFTRSPSLCRGST